MTSEDRCAWTSGYQPWSHYLIPSINLKQKRSLYDVCMHCVWDLFSAELAGTHDTASVHVLRIL